MKPSFLKYFIFPVFFLLVFQGEGRGEVFSGFGKEEQVLTAAKNHVNNLPLEGLALVKLTDAKAIAVQTSALPPNKMVELIKSYTIGDPSEIDFVGDMNSIQGFYVKAAIDARSVGKMDDVATFYAALEQVRKYRQLEPLKDHIDAVSDLWQDVEKLDLFISDLASNENLLDFFKAVDDATRLKYAGAWDKLNKSSTIRLKSSWLEGVNEWIDEGYEIVETSAGVLVKSNGDEVVEIVGDIPKWTNHKIIPELNSSVIKTADEVNPTYPGWDPPYHSDYPVVDFNTGSNEHFVRVFKEGSNNPQGAFVMKQSDIAGLSPSQIKDKYALDNIPDKIVDVSVPIGTSMRTGKVAPRPNGTSGGKIQFELREQIDGSNFTNIRDL